MQALRGNNDCSLSSPTLPCRVLDVHSVRSIKDIQTCGEIDINHFNASSDGDRKAQSFQMLPDDAEQFWCDGENAHANDNVEVKF